MQKPAMDELLLAGDRPEVKQVRLLLLQVTTEHYGVITRRLFPFPTSSPPPSRELGQNKLFGIFFFHNRRIRRNCACLKLAAPDAKSVPIAPAGKDGAGSDA